MKFVTLLLALSLCACQHTVADDNTVVVDKKKIKKTQLCGKSTTPIIKDKSKIETLLMKQGKITASMSEQEIKDKVNQYIRKKNAALKNCK
jgi:hypothetical protein